MAQGVVKAIAAFLILGWGWADGGLAAWAKAPAKVGIFGYLETPRQGLKAFPKWTGALERYFIEKAKTGGNCNSKTFNWCHYDKWNKMLASVKNARPERKLKKINDYMNKTRYIRDPINWGVKDYWETPGQFFDKFGDCEDYAIAKYLSLLAVGWDPSTLRIVVVQDMSLRVPHAVLAVYHKKRILLLDNQISIVVDASKIYHYRPIYSLNDSAWWRHTPKNKKRKRLRRRKPRKKR